MTAQQQTMTITLQVTVDLDLFHRDDTEKRAMPPAEQRRLVLKYLLWEMTENGDASSHYGIDIDGTVKPTPRKDRTRNA